MRTRLAAASPIQSAMKAPSRRSSAASTSSIRRRCSARPARTASALSRNTSIHIRGLAPGDPGHVPQRAAGVRERLVPLDARRTRLVDDDVREHVRKMARQRDELVVGSRLDRVREGAELADEAVDEGVALRARLGGRCEKPGGALEQAGRGVHGTVHLLARDRVTADEPRRAAGRGDDGRLRRADVGDGRLARRWQRAPRRPARRARRREPRRPRGLLRRPPAPSEPAGSTAQRSTACASASWSGSQPVTSAPEARASSAIEAPIRPVPTIASRCRAI